METTIQTYESLCILKPEVGEEKLNEKISEVEEIIKKHDGAIIAVDNWGKKRLAYRIKKVRNGLYILITFKILPEMISNLEKGLKLKEYIVKFITIHLDEKDKKTEEKVTEEKVTEEKEKEKK